MKDAMTIQLLAVVYSIPSSRCRKNSVESLNFSKKKVGQKSDTSFGGFRLYSSQRSICVTNSQLQFLCLCERMTHIVATYYEKLNER